MSRIRQHDSVRDIREGGFTLDAPEAPQAPAWINEATKKEFNNLVVGLIAAQVPLKAVDAQAVAMAASCIANVAVWTANEETAQTLKEKSECSKLVARYQRDSQKWLDIICATPAARARIGIRSTSKKEGKLEQLLKAKHGSW